MGSTTGRSTFQIPPMLGPMDLFFRPGPMDLNDFYEAGSPSIFREEMESGLKDDKGDRKLER